MVEVWTMGEILVEIMRPKVGMPLDKPGEFIGPFPSGSPAIFIDTISRLGHSSGIIGGVGDDDFGHCVTNRLKRDGVNCDYVLVDNTASTACAFVTYFPDGNRKFIFHMGNTPAAKAKTPEKLPYDSAKFFHVMGSAPMCNEQFAAEIIKAVDRFIRSGVKLSFDPNIRPELLKGRETVKTLKPILENSSVMFPGVEELLLISGESDIELAIEKMFRNRKLEIIALKRGSKGATIISRNERFDLGVYKTDVVDTTGAGDTFDAAFLCGLLEKRPLLECGKMAAAAASLNTSAFGPMEGDISRTTIQNMMESERINCH
jgi:sugar/nucleoside kinase (ribokinase family)